MPWKPPTSPVTASVSLSAISSNVSSSEKKARRFHFAPARIRIRFKDRSNAISRSPGNERRRHVANSHFVDPLSSHTLCIGCRRGFEHAEEEHQGGSEGLCTARREVRREKRPQLRGAQRKGLGSRRLLHFRDRSRRQAGLPSECIHGW